MGKAKSMKQKIRSPFLLLLILFPITTLLLFNVAFRLYMNKSAKNELKSVTVSMGTVIKREMPKNIKEFNADNLDRVFVKLYKALRLAKFSENKDILLYSSDRELLYPLAESGNAAENGGESLNSRIAKLLPVMQEGKVQSLRTGGKRYFVVLYPLTNSGSERPSIVFVAHTDQADRTINTVNWILLVLGIAGVAFGILTAHRLSMKIVRPVTELCGLTKAIGRGNFTLPEETLPTDIRELQALYANIGEMAGQLEAKETSQKAFLQNASHELRTPLMSIQGYAEGIAGGVFPDVKAAADIINHESQRLNKLVEELLTLSRIESQTYQKELVLVNLCDVLNEYAQRLGGYASKQQRELNLTLPDEPVHIWAEDSLLSQAVMNIASNCLRYSRSKADIVLLPDQDRAVIRVVDDGGGIPEKDLPHLFERFYKGQGGNFGLGLAIAKSAVEFMKGSVRAYNAPTGAVFEICLPIAAHTADYP